MRYLGNKSKLLDFIELVIKKHNVEGKTFVDLFSGTSSVGDHFKDRFKIISNDFMYYSYVFSRSKLLNNSVPRFMKFEKKYSDDIFEWLNKRIFKPNKHFFIYNNYTPNSERMFFTKSNGLKIDGIRISI